MHAVERSGMDQPFLVPREIIGCDHHFCAIQERDVDLLPIRGRRARSMAVQLVFPFEGRSYNRLLP